MRPCRSTPVASTVTMPAPDMASVIQCCRCQSVAEPSSAEYWHMGATAMRLGTVMPPMVSGEKSIDVMEFPESTEGWAWPEHGTPPPARQARRLTHEP